MKPRENSNQVSEQSHFSVLKKSIYTPLLKISQYLLRQSVGAKLLRVDTLKICHFNTDLQLQSVSPNGTFPLRFAIMFVNDSAN